MANDLLDNSMKETELGPLPSEWGILPLGDLATLSTGGTPRRERPEYWNGKIPWVKTGEVNYGVIRSTEEGITEDGMANSSARLYPAGTLLVAMYGQGVTRGRVAILGIEATINQACAAVRVGSTIETEFLFFAFQHQYEEIRDLGHGANQRNLNMLILRGVKFPVPPLEEQQAIAHVLRTVQRAKEATEKVIVAARQLKQSLMRHLFTYGPAPVDQADKVPLKETEIGPIPEHWQVGRLESVADLVSGGTPSKARPEFWQGLIPWASPKDMKLPRLYDVEDHISKEGAEEGSRIVPAGSLFIVIRGMILAKDLPVALAMVPMAFNQDMKAILPKPDLDAEYLLYCLNQHKNRMVPEIGTSAHGTKRIGTSAITDFQIPLPPKDEQEEIASMIACLDKKIEVEKAKRIALDILFQSKLHHLMTGKVRVNELEFPAMKEGSP